MAVVRALALACACLLAGCHPAGTLSGASPSPKLEALPSSITREAAVDAVRARNEMVGRIDRVAAKLMTLKEYYDVAGPLGAVSGDPKASPHIIGTVGVMGDPEMRMIWAVAVSGEVYPQMREPVFFGPLPHPRATPYPPYRWGLFVVDAARGGLLGFADAGVAEDWPPVFDKLPDHAALVGAPTLVDPCASLLHLPDVQISETFAARTVADLTTYLPQTLAWQRLVQDIAGVRSNPTQDPRVPHCRTDLLRMGTPVFARAYPAASGQWFVPLQYQDVVILTVFVDVDAKGLGTVGGNRGGAIPLPTEADARRVASTANDPVVSAEVILARPPGCGAQPTLVWRLVRASGTAVYFALDVFNATPPGVLFEEKDMRFSSGSAPRAASVPRAC